MLILVLSCALLAAAQNRIRNPGFEDGNAGDNFDGVWGFNNYGGLSTNSKVNSGSQAAQIGSALAATDIGLEQCVTLTDVASEIDTGMCQFTASGYFTRHTSGPARNAEIISESFTSNFCTSGGAGENLVTSLGVSDTYTLVQGTGTLPAGTRSVLVKFQFATLLAGEFGDLDDTSFVLFGSSHGDPHFHGFDGSLYNFDGVPGRMYNLLSDSNLQVNMEVTRGAVRGLEGNWMTRVALFTDAWSLVLDAARLSFDQRLFEHDLDFTVEGGHVSYTTKEDGAPLLLTVSLPSVGYTFEVVAQSAGDFVYFDIKAGITSVPVNPHGILGQTARFLVDGKNAEPKVVSAKNAAGFLEGGPSDYEVEAITAADCNLCTFNSGGESTRAALTQTFEASSF